MAKNKLNNKNYWQKREEEKLNKGVKDCNKLARDLEVQYKSASQYIEKEINSIFEKYAKDNNLTYSEASKYLKSDEYKVWRADIKGYLEMIEADEKVLLELNTLSAKSRITRWEALKSEVDKALINLNKKALKSTTELLTDTLVENYNTNAFNISKAIGYVANLAGIDEKMIEDI